MEKFWQWMESKNYFHDGHTYSESLTDYQLFRQNKQMLIGYMLEYLLEKDITNIQEWNNIDDFYNECKIAIEAVNEN